MMDTKLRCPSTYTGTRLHAKAMDIHTFVDPCIELTVLK